MTKVIELGSGCKVITIDPKKKRRKKLLNWRPFKKTRNSTCTPTVDHLSAYLDSLELLEFGHCLTDEQITLLKSILSPLLETCGGFLELETIEKIRNEMGKAKNGKEEIRNNEKDDWDREASKNRTLIPRFNYPDIHAQFTVHHWIEPSDKLAFLNSRTESDHEYKEYVPERMELVEIYFFVVLRMLRFQFDKMYNDWSKTKQAAHSKDFLLT